MQRHCDNAAQPRIPRTAETSYLVSEQIADHQQAQAGNVSTLQRQVQDTRALAVQQSAAQDFTRRTEQSTALQTVQQQMAQQADLFQKALEQMQAEMHQMKVDRIEKDVQIEQLQKSLQEEKEARGEMQQFVDNAMANMQPVELMETDLPPFPVSGDMDPLSFGNPVKKEQVTLGMQIPSAPYVDYAVPYASPQQPPVLDSLPPSLPSQYDTFGFPKLGREQPVSAMPVKKEVLVTPQWQMVPVTPPTSTVPVPPSVNNQEVGQVKQEVSQGVSDTRTNPKSRRTGHATDDTSQASTAITSAYGTRTLRDGTTEAPRTTIFQGRNERGHIGMVLVTPRLLPPTPDDRRAERCVCRNIVSRQRTHMVGLASPPCWRTTTGYA